jgi:hypothetical protein
LFENGGKYSAAPWNQYSFGSLVMLLAILRALSLVKKLPCRLLDQTFWAERSTSSKSVVVSGRGAAAGR